METQNVLKSWLAPILAGAVVGILCTYYWLPPALIVFAPLSVIMFWRKPEYGLYVFIALVVILTDAVDKDIEGIFAIKDVKIQGLPPFLICFLLAMCFVYFFKLYFIEGKKSIISVKYGFVVIVVLLIATGTGIWLGSDPTNLKDDFYSVLYPVLCFYLCANVLDTREKVYRMLGVLFLVGLIVASIYDIYYLRGHGWPYESDDLGSRRIVTRATQDLMVFVAMTITIYSASASSIITGWRRTLGYLGCVPMVFAILFSFRRSHWLGMIAAIAVFYFLSSALEKRKTIFWVWVGIVMLTAAILFSGDMANAPITRRVMSLADRNQDSNVHHLLESQQTLKDILSSPILGLGLGSKHSPVSGIDWAPEDQPTKIVHNTYLLIWMKLGMPGLFLFMWMVVKYVSLLMSYHKSTAPTYSGPIIASTGATVGHWFVLLLTGPVLAYWYQTFIIGLFAAMVLALIREERRGNTGENSTLLHNISIPYISESHRG